jgi:hypothetical protein
MVLTIATHAGTSVSGTLKIGYGSMAEVYNVSGTMTGTALALSDGPATFDATLSGRTLAGSWRLHSAAPATRWSTKKQ